MAVEAALLAVGEAAELWGAEWHRSGTGGRLSLPVRAGIRYGLVEGEVSSQRAAAGCRLRLDVERSVYELHMASLVVLLLGAGGALYTVVAPMLHRVFADPADALKLLPVAMVLMLLAWFLVVARIRNRNVADFFSLVRELAEGSTGEPEDSGSPAREVPHRSTGS